MTDKNTVSFTIEPVGLTVVFIFLKLFGAIEWSWFWVFSPIWLVGLAVIFLAILMGTLAAINEWNDTNERR